MLPVTSGTGAAVAETRCRPRSRPTEGRPCEPVLLSTSYLPAPPVEGSAITRPDAGPGGIYARLAELGYGPLHFREEIRSRMPLPEEVAKLRLPAGTPVMLICRTAFAAEGRVVEVNEMVLDTAAYVLEYDFDA
ncbi:GntR family transcriptional regulator [Streptomyces sp. CS014]|nr:GntR family transcriptional regulator [Streptomyces sp. CS014]